MVKWYDDKVQRTFIEVFLCCFFWVWPEIDKIALPSYSVVDAGWGRKQRKGGGGELGVGDIGTPRPFSGHGVQKNVGPVAGLGEKIALFSPPQVQMPLQ